MEAISFDEENEILNKPEELTVDECAPLPIWRGQLDNGWDAIISCWKINAQELEEIIRTGRIWIIALGQEMCPLFPTGTRPFKAVSDGLPPNGESNETSSGNQNNE